MVHFRASVAPRPIASASTPPSICGVTTTLEVTIAEWASGSDLSHVRGTPAAPQMMF
jgi:hypothetical protein